jgi:hypothetical protein
VGVIAKIIFVAIVVVAALGVRNIDTIATAKPVEPFPRFLVWDLLAGA